MLPTSVIQLAVCLTNKCKLNYDVITAAVADKHFTHVDQVGS